MVPVLNGIAFKQQFNEFTNGKIQTNRDQKREFNSRLLKIDKKSYKDIDVYYIEYIAIKKIGDCGNIYSVNPLYW